MTRAEQKRFVRDLSRSVIREIEERIDAGKFPEEWNGFELRWFLAERFQEATLKTAIANRSRFREFKNTVLVNNL